MAAVLESTLGGIGSLVTAPIRSYLTKLIRDQLLHYVREDCIDMQRISLGGTLILHNLELKLDVLRHSLGVPLTFEISRGFIRTLQIHIPWTNLLGQPIEVKIDTVMIVIGLKTDAELQETARQMPESHQTAGGCDDAPRDAHASTNAAATRATIDASNGGVPRNQSRNRSAEYSANGEGSGQDRNDNDGDASEVHAQEEEGWLSSLIKRVIYNAKITVKDLIFKYDNSEGRVLTAMLSSLRIFSADPRNKWRVSEFFEPQGKLKRMCKAALAQGLSIRLDRRHDSNNDPQTTPSSRSSSGSRKPIRQTDGSLGSESGGRRGWKSENGSMWASTTSQNRRFSRYASTYEVPILRRANITFRGWFNLCPLYDSNSQYERRPAGHTNSNILAAHDPFEGFNGWHTGMHEINDTSPTSLIDVHCPCLNFAFSESQIQIMTEILERADQAERVLRKEIAAARMRSRSRGTATLSSSLSEPSATPKLTTQGVKAMLEQASARVDAKERKRVRKIRKRRLQMEAHSQGPNTAHQLKKEKELQSSDRQHPGIDPNEPANPAGEEGGLIGGVLSWAWNTIVGEDSEEPDKTKEEKPANNMQENAHITSENNRTKNSEYARPKSDFLGLRSFSVTGIRFDRIGLDLLLHVRGPKRCESGPMHTRFTTGTTSQRFPNVEPGLSTDILKVHAPAKSSQISVGRSSSGRAGLRVGKTFEGSTSESMEAETSRTNGALPSEISHGVVQGILGNYPSEAIQDEPSAYEMAGVIQRNTRARNIVKVRTPNGYVEVDMGDNTESPRSSVSPSHQHRTITRKNAAGQNTFSRRINESAESCTSGMPDALDHEKWLQRQQQQHIEAFASLHFAGIEMEYRSHSWDSLEMASIINGESRRNQDDSHFQAMYGTNTETGHYARPRDSLDVTFLLDVRSVGCWGLPSSYRTLYFSEEQEPDGSKSSEKCVATLPPYFVLWGACALHDCETACLLTSPGKNRASGRLSSISTTSLSPPVSPALAAYPSPLNSAHNAVTTRANIDSMTLPPPSLPKVPVASPLRSSGRRPSSSSLEWVAQPFLLRRIELNLPPPKEIVEQDVELPKLASVLEQSSCTSTDAKGIKMLPAQGRALRIRWSRFVTKEGGHQVSIRDADEDEISHVSQLALGHATLRIDPETVADLQVLLLPCFSSPTGTSDGRLSDIAETKGCNQEHSQSRSIDTQVEAEKTSSHFSISSAGFDAWIVLDAPEQQNKSRLNANKQAVAKENRGFDYAVSGEKPSWLLLEVSSCIASSTAGDTATSTAGAPCCDEEKVWGLKCEAIRLCTGSLTHHVGETGFHRGLAMQLAAKRIEDSNNNSSLRFWHLSRTGLHRMDRNISDADKFNMQGTKFTLAMTDDGAPIKSDFVEIVNLHKLFLKQRADGEVLMHPSGTCKMDLGAGRMPFLGACWYALFNDPWESSEIKDRIPRFDSVKHYWLRTFSSIDANVNQAVNASESSTNWQDSTGEAINSDAEKKKATQIHSTAAAASEIERLRKELAVAKAQANHWRHVAESL